MPNIVLEKNGQTYRFKLHEDKSVTRGKFISVPFNGKEYYARYGDTSTPLKTEINGREYSVQYDPVDFQTIIWNKKVTGSFTETKTIFIPRGKYKISMEYQKYRLYDVTVTSNENRIVIVTIKISASKIVNYRLEIQGIFDNNINGGYFVSDSPFKYSIERIGD